MKAFWTKREIVDGNKHSEIEMYVVPYEDLLSEAEAHKKTGSALQTRYEELLEQANKLQEFLKLEEMYLTNGTVECEQKYRQTLKNWECFKKVLGIE